MHRDRQRLKPEHRKYKYCDAGRKVFQRQLHSGQGTTTRCVINAIPPEMLGEIFLSSVTRSECVAGMVFNYPYRGDAYRLTEICQHWRAVALATPSLWCGVVCGDKEDQKPPGYHLRLSKSAPLHAIFKGDLKVAMSILQAYPGRIHHLLLTDSAPWDRRSVPPKVLARATPNLRTCTLELNLGSCWPIPERGICTLFAPEGPLRLRSLAVRTSYLIPADSFPNLRELYLHGLGGMWKVPPILALLERCPLLEEVSVHCSQKPGIGTIPLPEEHSEAVELAHARDVVLSVPRSAWLLAHLSLPLSAHVHIEKVTLEDLSHWSPLPAPLRMDEVGLTDTRLYISRLRHKGTDLGFRIELAGPVSYRFDIASSPSVCPKPLVNMFDTADLHFSNITVLWVLDAAAIMLLPFILPALPSLRALGAVLDKAGLPELTDTLRGEVCPSLAALYVSSRNQKVTLQVQRLRDLITARAGAGRRIARVALELTLPDGVPDQDEDEHMVAAHVAAIRTCVDEFSFVPHATNGQTLPGWWDPAWGNAFGACQ